MIFYVSVPGRRFTLAFAKYYNVPSVLGNSFR